MCDHKNNTLVVHSLMWRDFFGGPVGAAQYWICNECNVIGWLEPRMSMLYKNPAEFKHAVFQWLNKEKLNAVSHLGQAFGRPEV